MRERLPQMSAECTECTDVSRGLSAHRALERELRDTRRDAPENLVLHRLRSAVNDVEAVIELVEKCTDLRRRVLEVVIHRDDHVVASAADPGEQRVVLPVVSHEVEAADELV